MLLTSAGVSPDRGWPDVLETDDAFPITFIDGNFWRPLKLGRESQLDHNSDMHLNRLENLSTSYRVLFRSRQTDTHTHTDPNPRLAESQLWPTIMGDAWAGISVYGEDVTANTVCECFRDTENSWNFDIWGRMWQRQYTFCKSNILVHYIDSISRYIKGPIFSKAVLKCRWLLEHENLSKVRKYTGKFLNSISQFSESISKSFSLTCILCTYN